jgi:membrane-associated phospholipid phosphatase
VLSEGLHLAYLSYYLIIYAPALVFWMRDRRTFANLALAVSVAMVTCFVVFTLFPVAGPRYSAPPTGGDSGPIRHLTLSILERGSSRGTAFPSSHVAIASAIAWSSIRRIPALGWSLVLLSALLAVGAVYGGFHYGIDVVFGAVVGGVSSLVAHRWGSTVASA